MIDYTLEEALTKNEPTSDKNDDIIYKELEPGVINAHMINSNILQQGHKGEAGRLTQLTCIDYKNITILRLEFQNIFKIDNLWVMPNLEQLSLKFNKLDQISNIEMLTKLKNLDLSFNFIAKIDNLETLVNLKVLSLFNNKITKLENLDALEGLSILSVGNNEIDTLIGIERLRFMRNLHSLNLEGNPIARNFTEKGSTFRGYIAAFLPNLKYYNYAYINDEERAQSCNEFRVELHQLEEIQEEEIKLRNEMATEVADEKRLSLSFVELLNHHQLIDSLFAGDEEGGKLLLIGEESDELVRNYRQETYEITQQIYELGLEKHEVRIKEIRKIEKCINSGKETAETQGIRIIEEFLSEEKRIFEDIKMLLPKIDELQKITDNDIEVEFEQFNKLKDLFENKLNATWHLLMENEIQLFESIEEEIVQFGQNIHTMIDKFIEAVQTLFVQLRDIAANFSESLLETVSKFITAKLAASDEASVPIELKDCLEDKENITNLISGSRKYHLQKIDNREDQLINRSRFWASELIRKMHSEEIQRNRAKVLEINYFLNKQREAFDRLKEPVDADDDDI